MNAVALLRSIQLNLYVTALYSAATFQSPDVFSIEILYIYLSPVLSGHAPVISSRGHSLPVPVLFFVIIFTCIKWPPSK